MAPGPRRQWPRRHLGPIVVRQHLIIIQNVEAAETVENRIDSLDLLLLLPPPNISRLRLLITDLVPDEAPQVLSGVPGAALEFIRAAAR